MKSRKKQLLGSIFDNILFDGCLLPRFYRAMLAQSQHRPMLFHVGLQLPVIRSSNKVRWNFRKANWSSYSDVADRSIPTIPVRSIPVEESYKRFCQAIFKAASKSVTRGRRPTYILCFDAECEELLKQYEESNDPDVADHLLESLDAARLSR